MSPPQDTLIGQVPSQTVKQANLQLTPYDGRVAEFNVAAWLHLPGQANSLVSLQAEYRDGGRTRSVNIDHAKVGPNDRLLLSGIARLPAEQSIRDMQIKLRHTQQGVRVVVEELFVQAVEPETAAMDSRQASN